jgi:hypothetical protein
MSDQPKNFNSVSAQLQFSRSPHVNSFSKHKEEEVAQPEMRIAPETPSPAETIEHAIELRHHSELENGLNSSHKQDHQESSTYRTDTNNAPPLGVTTEAKFVQGPCTSACTRIVHAHRLLIRSLRAFQLANVMCLE